MMTTDDQDRELALLTSLARVADRDDEWDSFAHARVRERLRDPARSADPRRRWRPAALAVIGVVAVSGGAAIATAAIVGGEPAREEVRSYADDAGIPEEEARSELLDQRQLTPLVTAARERLGGNYAGVWVDAEGTRRIVLALADGAPPQAEADARAIIAGVGLEGRVDIVRRPLSEQQLETLRRTLDAELVRVNRGAPSTVDVEVDLATSVVIVRRPPRAATARQRQFLAGVRRRYGSELRIADSPGPLKVGTAG